MEWKMSILKKTITVILGTVIAFVPAVAETKKIKLKLTYNNKVKLPLMTLNNRDELDFILEGKNISVYYLDAGQLKFIGDRSSGHGYYAGPVDLRFRASKDVI